MARKQIPTRDWNPVRISPEVLKLVDAWRERQPGHPSQIQAVEMLLTRALDGEVAP